jgi:hypothetical protein
MAQTVTPTIVGPIADVSDEVKPVLTQYPTFSWEIATTDEIEYFIITIERFPGDLPFSPVTSYTITDGTARNYKPTTPLAVCKINPPAWYPYLVWSIKAKAVDQDLSEQSNYGAFQVADELVVNLGKIVLDVAYDGVREKRVTNVKVTRAARREDK